MNKEEIQRQQELEEEAQKHTWNNREEIEKRVKTFIDEIASPGQDVWNEAEIPI